MKTNSRLLCKSLGRLLAGFVVLAYAFSFAFQMSAIPPSAWDGLDYWFPRAIGLLHDHAEIYWVGDFKSHGDLLPSLYALVIANLRPAASHIVIALMVVSLIFVASSGMSRARLCAFLGMIVCGLPLVENHFLIFGYADLMFGFCICGLTCAASMELERKGVRDRMNCVFIGLASAGVLLMKNTGAIMLICIASGLALTRLFGLSMSVRLAILGLLFFGLLSIIVIGDLEFSKYDSYYGGPKLTLFSYRLGLKVNELGLVAQSMMHALIYNASFSVLLPLLWVSRFSSSEKAASVSGDLWAVGLCILLFYLLILTFTNYGLENFIHRDTSFSRFMLHLLPLFLLSSLLRLDSNASIMQRSKPNA